MQLRSNVQYLGLKGDPNFLDLVIFCFGVDAKPMAHAEVDVKDIN